MLNSNKLLTAHAQLKMGGVVDIHDRPFFESLVFPLCVCLSLNVSR